MHRDPSTRFRDRFRAALRDAMAARDSVSVAALRSVLGAIDNAEAVDAVPAVPVGESTIAGAVLGLGAGDVPRRQLSETELRQVVQREVEERAAVAEQYDRVGRPDRAERLRAEAAVLAGHLPALTAPHCAHRERQVGTILRRLAEESSQPGFGCVDPGWSAPTSRVEATH